MALHQNSGVVVYPPLSPTRWKLLPQKYLCATQISALYSHQNISVAEKFWEKSLHLLLPAPLPPPPCSVTSLSSLYKGPNSHKHSSCQSLTTIQSWSWARCSHHLRSQRTQSVCAWWTVSSVRRDTEVQQKLDQSHMRTEDGLSAAKGIPDRPRVSCCTLQSAQQLLLEVEALICPKLN